MHRHSSTLSKSHQRNLQSENWLHSRARLIVVTASDSLNVMENSLNRSLSGIVGTKNKSKKSVNSKRQLRPSNKNRIRLYRSELEPTMRQVITAFVAITLPLLPCRSPLGGQPTGAAAHCNLADRGHCLDRVGPGQGPTGTRRKVTVVFGNASHTPVVVKGLFDRQRPGTWQLLPS